MKTFIVTLLFSTAAIASPFMNVEVYNKSRSPLIKCILKIAEEELIKRGEPALVNGYFMHQDAKPIRKVEYVVVVTNTTTQKRETRKVVLSSIAREGWSFAMLDGEIGYYTKQMSDQVLLTDFQNRQLAQLNVAACP